MFELTSGTVPYFSISEHFSEFYLGESLIRLESPDTLRVGVEGGDAALLPQRPQADRPVAAAGQALRPVPVQHERLQQ